MADQEQQDSSGRFGSNQIMAISFGAAAMALTFALVLLGKIDGNGWVSFVQVFVPVILGIALGISGGIKVTDMLTAKRDQ